MEKYNKNQPCNCWMKFLIKESHLLLSSRPKSTTNPFFKALISGKYPLLERKSQCSLAHWASTASQWRIITSNKFLRLDSTFLQSLLQWLKRGQFKERICSASQVPKYKGKTGLKSRLKNRRKLGNGLWLRFQLRKKMLAKQRNRLLFFSGKRSRLIRRALWN